jgi:hypothetical protein
MTLPVIRRWRGDVEAIDVLRRFFSRFWLAEKPFVAIEVPPTRPKSS